MAARPPSMLATACRRAPDACSGRPCCPEAASSAILDSFTSWLPAGRAPQLHRGAELRASLARPSNGLATSPDAIKGLGRRTEQPLYTSSRLCCHRTDSWPPSQSSISSGTPCFQ